MTQPTLTLTPRKSALLAHHDNVLDVLVEIHAPELPEEQRPQRPPLQIALVLDRSGSMAGAPLHEAKRCAEFVIDGLTDADRASLVVYDNRVHTLVETRDLRDRDVFKRALRNVETGGATKLHGGWHRGAESLLPDAGHKTLSRVILLSDGCANRGISDTPTIAEHCAAMAAQGVTTSTYGLGHHFNEELMVEMARAGQGNSYYGESAEDLMDPFQEELALLNALYGQGLELAVEPLAGVQVELRNGYRQSGDGRWRLPDLAYGGVAWALLRLRVPKAMVEGIASGNVQDVLSVRALYRDLGGVHFTTEPTRLSLPTLGAEAFASVAEYTLVQRRADELEAAEIQDAARQAALEGDWSVVDTLLEKIRALGADNDWIQGIESELRKLSRKHDQAHFAKEAHYSSSRMQSRLSHAAELEGMLGTDVPDYLRRKTAQGKKSHRRSP